MISDPVFALTERLKSYNTAVLSQGLDGVSSLQPQVKILSVLVEVISQRMYGYNYRSDQDFYTCVRFSISEELAGKLGWWHLSESDLVLASTLPMLYADLNLMGFEPETKALLDRAIYEYSERIPVSTHTSPSTVIDSCTVLHLLANTYN